VVLLLTFIIHKINLVVCLRLVLDDINFCFHGV
jgi:hypothetical protein